MIRILKLEDEDGSSLFIVGIGEEPDKLTINRYPEEAIMHWLCNPHSEPYEYRTIRRNDYHQDTEIAVTILECFDVLYKYGNLSQNQIEMNESLEIIWKEVK